MTDDWRSNVTHMVWEDSGPGYDHNPGPIPLDPIAPTPRSTSAKICRGLGIENGFRVFKEVEKVGETEGEREGGGDAVVGEMTSTDTERLERHGKRARVGE
jgi:hypothetical protein